VSAEHWIPNSYISKPSVSGVSPAAGHIVYTPHSAQAEGLSARAQTHGHEEAQLDGRVSHSPAPSKNSSPLAKHPQNGTVKPEPLERNLESRAFGMELSERNLQKGTVPSQQQPERPVGSSRVDVNRKSPNPAQFAQHAAGLPDPRMFHQPFAGQDATCPLAGRAASSHSFHHVNGPPPNPQTLDPHVSDMAEPSRSQWQRLNASLKEQSASLHPSVKQIQPPHLVNPNPVEVTGNSKVNPGMRPSTVQQPVSSQPQMMLIPAEHDVSNQPLPEPNHANPGVFTNIHPPNPPRFSLSPQPAKAPLPRVTTPASKSEWEPNLKGPVNRGSPGSHRSSGEWLPTSQAPAGPPSVEPPRKLRRLRKAKSGMEGSPSGMERNPGGMERSVGGRQGVKRKGGRKEAMQSTCYSSLVNIFCSRLSPVCLACWVSSF
jgi:hypothetical protein